MQVGEKMTKGPVCCTRDTSLRDAARLMSEWDCGEIPVVDAEKRPIGVITDRDICCRGVAAGKNPDSGRVEECMSAPVVTVQIDTSIEDCCRIMEEHQVRRLPVVDRNGACCGIISQADLAQACDDYKVGEVVREVSRPVHH